MFIHLLFFSLSFITVKRVFKTDSKEFKTNSKVIPHQSCISKFQCLVSKSKLFKHLLTARLQKVIDIPWIISSVLVLFKVSYYTVTLLLLVETNSSYFS